MNLIAVVAFCVAVEGEPVLPLCVYVEEPSHGFYTETSCAIAASNMADDPAVLQAAANNLFAEYGYIGQMHYSTYCVEKENLTHFFTTRGIEVEEETEDE